MFNQPVLGKPAENHIFQESCVCEIQAFIQPQGQDAWVGLHLVAVNVAKMFGAGHQPHLGDMRA